MFEKAIGAMRAGEPYYKAMGTTLRLNGYPTASLFNWRTPLLYELIAALPSGTWARSILVLLAVAAAASTYMVAAKTSVLAALITGFMSSGVVLVTSAPAAVGMTEAWAGALIALSVCAYLRRRWTWGFALGVAALFIRELAAPYVALCMILALWQRRNREVAAWLLAGTLYGVFYWIHSTHVAAAQLPSDISHSGSWIALGGLPFLLSTIRWNGWLLVAPSVATALALAAIASGVLSPATPLVVRLAAAGYASMFLIIGQPFNVYWGFLIWPTWCLALGYGAQSIVDDVRALVRRSP